MDLGPRGAEASHCIVGLQVLNWSVSPFWSLGWQEWGILG